MASRKIQVQLGFSADTSQAQSQIQQLQSTLQSIANTKVTVHGGSIDQAAQSARMLSQHLAAATNVNTGRLDFSALQTSLKAANTDLTTLTNSLLAMGPKGQQAFSQVANAVAHAELSVKKTNSALQSFGVTLMNTIKWQAASTMIHGVMSAFSSAIGHIEKLDKALNNIQIVTGKTSAEMAAFAKRAQELSKALSSTTEEYSKASLIYFQQGLGEKAVLDRTEATIKMAKVTGEAVETVSDQLTAIWNNFDDGTKSLEYYVDIITALGAATASSTSEISDGLQKFAAIAETVGLSYEYAATALATITAETRQSADVVGTALKTLFARMEGLKLGETLEDGTTLNQYSMAMAKAGINIKDANGNLKDMDTILDEMGEKWQSLNKDQQIALAQQVGGIRQYNQLIALMDNWDTFKINLEIAEESKGELDKQFEIYQDSIEASEKALQNAKESLYESLFNPQMIKDFNNGLAEALDIIKRLVENAGGLKGLLQFGGLLILKTLLPQLQGFITKITTQVSTIIGLTQRQKINTVEQTAKVERKTSGQEATRSWGGQGDRANKAFTKAGIADSRGDISKRDKYLDRGKKIAANINKKEQAIVDHRNAAEDARRIREEENISRIKDGKRAKVEGFGERWHRRQAEQLEERATASGRPRATTLGVKQTNLPVQHVDSSMSAGEMSTQINKEQAGYTAAILDAKKEYLMIENQLTDKQRAQYKNYEDQLNAEADLLRIARERQLVSKQTAEQGLKTAEEAIEMSDKGGKALAKSAKKQAKADLEADASKADLVANKKEYDSQMAALDKEEEELNSKKGGKKGSQAKRAEIARKRKELQSGELGKANKAYEQEVQDRADVLTSSADFTKTSDLGGSKTKGAGAGLQKGISGASGAEQASLTTVAQAAGMGADGSGAAVASIENLEKLGTLQGQYNADAQIAVDLQGELGNAIGASAASAKKGTKEYETGNKALKQSGTFAKKYSAEMKAAAKELKKAGQLSQDQVDAVEALADAGADVELEGMKPEALAGIQKTLGKVESGLTKAGAAAGKMADTMATDMAAATGQTKDTFTAVSEGTKQLAIDSAEAEQQVAKVNQAALQPMPVQPDPYGGLVMGAQGAMQAITGLTMGTQMLSMGLQTAFDPEATGIERLTGLMMTMQGVQSMLTAAQGAYNIVLGLGNVIAAAAQVIREKGMLGLLKEIGLKYLDTAATIVNAVAKVFNAEASKGLAGVIMGVVATALLLGTFFMVKNTMATEENTEAAQNEAKAQEEVAKGAAEAAKAAREEMDAINKLTDAYLDALTVYEKTGEGKNELNKAAIEAADAMGIEGLEVAILAGNYADLTREIKKYNAAKVGTAIDTSKAAVAAGGASFISSEGKQDNENGGMYSYTSGGKTYLALSLGHKTAQDEGALRRWLAVNPDSPWQIGENGEQGVVQAEYSSANDIAWLMSEFYKMYNGVSAIATNGELERMEFFSSINEMRESGTFEEGQELAESYNTHADTVITGQKSIHLTSETDTQEEYDQAYEKIKEEVLASRGVTANSLEGKALIDMLNQNLSKDEAFQDYELRRRALSEFTDGQYKDRDAGKFVQGDQFEKWYKNQGLSKEEALDVFLKINPQYLNTSGIEEALNRMQEYLEANKLIVKYDLVSEAKGALKDTMTSQDWNEFYTKYEELFDPTSDNYIGMSFIEFTEQSATQRKSLLNDALGSTKEAYQQQINTTEKQLKNMQTTDYKDNYVKDLVASEENEINTYNDNLKQIAKGNYDEDTKEDFTSSASMYEAKIYRDYKNGVKITGKDGKEYDPKTTDFKTYYRTTLQTKYYDSSGTYNGQTSDVMWNNFQNWINENGDWDSVEQYLEARVNYLGALDEDNGFELEGLKTFNKGEAKGRAEAAYDDMISETQTQLEGLKNSAHLASLAEVDAAIEDYDLDADAVYDMANAISETAVANKDFADSLKNDSHAARLAAVEIARFNRAVEAIDGSYGDWMEALESDNLSELTIASAELKTMYADLLNMDPSDFTTEFIQSTENLALAQQAAAGDANAYNQLQILSIQALGEQYKTLSDTVIAGLTKIAGLDTVDVGEKVVFGGENGDLATQLQDYYNKAVEAAILGGAETAEAIAYATNLINQAGYNITGLGGTEVKKSNGKDIEVAVSMSFTKTAETIGGKRLESDGNKNILTLQSDILDRYKEVDDKLSDIEKKMSDASSAADRLWGPNRVTAMEKVNEALEENIELLKDKRAEAKYNLTQDRNELAKALSENAGISLTDAMFDENGNFIQYDEILTGLYNQLHREEVNAGTTVEDHEKEKIDKIQERIDAVKKAIENYDETNQLIKDLDTEIQEGIYEWQDNNYEVLNLQLEDELDINEKDLEVLDYYLAKAESDIYAYTEAISLYNSQAGLYTDNLESQKSHFEKLTEAYKNGEISESAYKEGLAESQSAIISNLQSLNEAKVALQDYYGNVMSMAREEIGLYTAEMEQLNSVLDHYSSILDILGKQNDTAFKQKILTTKATNLKNEITVQEQLYQKSMTAAEDWAKKMSEATLGSNEYETYKKNWQAAQEAANEAQDTMLSKTEEWAEAMKSIIETELEEFADLLEKSLTGGTSFDELLTSMERRSSLQEEYLTTTNKIYETNKMMRAAQQEIDKTTNSVAKKKLQGFINETNQLQNQTKLSQYELDIQQAKYDLLLAEIALEEAQNAKSTVRLQRDSEGNFGYVYTADAAAISQAEQDLADKQNALYNLGLEGANNYQQKYAETLQESQDAITELTQMWMNGEIASEEEFNRRKAEIVEYYGEKLRQYTELHTVALSADSRVASEAWSTEFYNMSTSVAEWQSAVDNYFSEAAESMSTWNQVCAETLEKSGLKDIDTTLQGVGEKSQAWLDLLLGKGEKPGLIDALLSQVDAAAVASETQLELQNAIDGTTESYEGLLEAINKAYKVIMDPPKAAISTEGGEYTPTTPASTGNSDKKPTWDNGTYSQDEVKEVQQWLNSLKDNDTNIDTDGYWGSKSTEMAKSFGYTSLLEAYEAMQDDVTISYTYSINGTIQKNKSFNSAKAAATDALINRVPLIEYVYERLSYKHKEDEYRSIGPIKNYLTTTVSMPQNPAFGGVAMTSFNQLDGGGGVRLPVGGGGFMRYDTGGYTGSWGPYGKLAVLDEKELVLNKGDTENFLMSMNVLERILQVLDLQAISSQLGGVLSSPHFSSVSSSPLEQNVHIEASFPNATDHNEIEEAFNNLVNLASQYANRK